MSYSDQDFDISGFVPGAAAFADIWEAEASEFRAREAAIGRARLNVPYGPGNRQALDLFHPSGKARGLTVFVHGGYWHKFHRNFWSHYAQGLTEANFAVAMPSYTLAPEARIHQMAREIAAAVETAAGLVAGPISITGHSAGGHLSARMACRDAALSEVTRARITKITPISPLVDLRPLKLITMNDILGLDEDETVSESPVLHPRPDVPVTVWVGAEERPVFLDQAKALSQHWAAEYRIAPGCNHFDILDGLRTADTALVRSIIES